MRNPLKRREKALTASPAVIDALNNRGWTPWPMLGGGSRQRILDAYATAKSASYAWTYTNSPAVRTVVDVIVRNVGQLDLRLYEEVAEDERKPRPDHAAALSLRYPSEDRTADAFIRALMKDYLIFDDAFALIEPAVENRISLHWIPAHMVEVRGSSLFVAEQYRVWRADGTWIDFAPEQIFHWHGENPHDPRVGLSRLDTLRSVTAEDVALQQATIELAQSGLSESMWVYRPAEAPQWSNAAREGFEEDLHNRIARRNTTPPVLEEGMELRPFGVSPRDAQMLEVRRWAIERVAAVYGVPLGMVGLEGDLKAAQSEFYADVLPPICEDFCDFLNQRVLVKVFGWTDGAFEFNLDEKLMGDERLTALVSATGRAVMLTNEARAMVNLPPVPTGDKLVTPLNVLVGENPKPSPQVMPPQKPGGPAQDGSARTGGPQTPSTQTSQEEEKGEAAAQDVHTKRSASGTGRLPDSDLDAIRGALIRTYDRWQNTDRRGKRSAERFGRELARELAELNGELDWKTLRAVTGGLADGLQETLAQSDDASKVFADARAGAGHHARKVMAELRWGGPEAMKRWGAPTEVVWETAGFSEHEIDRMRAMEMTRDLLSANGHDDARNGPGAQDD